MISRIVSQHELKSPERLLGATLISPNHVVGLVHDYKEDVYSLLSLQDTSVQRVGLSQALPAFNIYRTHLKNLAFKAILFRMAIGFGLIVRDRIYRFAPSLSLIDELVIDNDFPPDPQHRDFNPYQVRELADGLLAVTFSYCRQSATLFSLLKLADSTATYLSPPRELSIADETRPGPAVIGAIGSRNHDLLAHAIGPDRNWYKYGMAYSVLCRVDSRDGAWVSEGLEIPKGFGHFSADNSWLILHPIAGKGVLHFLGLDGKKSDLLQLTPKNNLGFLTKDFLNIDAHGNFFLLHNANGAVMSTLS